MQGLILCFSFREHTGLKIFDLYSFENFHYLTKSYNKAFMFFCGKSKVN